MGKKLLTGITGLILVGFVGVHLLGNLLLLSSTEAFNRYGAELEQVKPLVWGIEGGLLLAIALHALLGIQIYLNKKSARPAPYESYRSINQVNQVSPVQTSAEAPLPSSVQIPSIQTSDGKPSFQTLSSRSMLWTGLTLAAFVVWHLVTFKFGPRYEVMIDGHPSRDLARLVIETFRQPAYTFSYVGLIGLLGLHLRHGLWSALQSLGALGKGMQAIAFGAAFVGAGAIAAGYILVPLSIYVGWIR